jgi:hypothetical protein
MSTFTQLQRNRRIIRDFESTALAGTPNPFARLIYVTSLKQSGSDTHQHTRLAAVYGEEAMRQALAQYHEELFERILESPWSIQDAELRVHLGGLSNGLFGAAANWRTAETYRGLIPPKSPDYLRELFCSNMRAMLDIIVGEASTAVSAN